MVPLLHSGELYALLCALVWAVAVIYFRKSGEQVPPVALNLFKGVVGLVLLVPTVWIVGSSFVPESLGWRDWALLLASGALGIGVADSLFFASLNRLGAGRSAIVGCLYSPLVVLCAAVWLGEPVGIALLAGMTLLMGGIFVGTWQPEPHATPLAARRMRVGVGLGALSILCMAIGIVMVKPVLNRSELVWATMVRTLGGAAFVAAQSALSRDRANAWRVFVPSRQWRSTLTAAFLGSYLAMILWLAGMKYTSVSVAGVLNQTSTLLTPLLAAAWLEERLTGRKILATAMGFAGTIVVTLWGRG